MEANNSPLEKKIRKRPLIIAGPCSAETKDQVIRTAVELQKTGLVDYYRAGIWKPRTRPGTFEGIGTKGLPWLQEAKKLTKLPVTVEVANAKQVEDALHFEIDMLWIGARSVVNPASVQEIANALRGSDARILIKNPLSPVLDLWTGAVERIENAGIKNIGLVHRGFSNLGSMEFRNAPMWHLALEMRKRHPGLAMICDPSHISGNRNLIGNISRKAADMGFDGLMVETHISPDKAWSDSGQQITPEQFRTILQDIHWQENKTETKKTSLDEFREVINLIDDELLTLLAKRMKMAQKIGEYKKDHKIKILQKTRWNEVLQKVIRTGKSLGLSPEFIKMFYASIHSESLSKQKKYEKLNS